MSVCVSVFVGACVFAHAYRQQSSSRVARCFGSPTFSPEERLAMNLIYTAAV